jgi:hypothetical protein
MNRSDNSPTNSKRFDRLVLIQVLGLFGVFDHAIPLGDESNITVIHGPNGVGKTIILRMIREVFSGKPDVLARIPFDNLILEFESGDRVVLFPEKGREFSDSARRIAYEASLGSEIKTGAFAATYDPATVERITESLGPTWQYLGDGRWIDRADGEIIGVESLVRRVRLPAKALDDLQQTDPALSQLRSKCNVRFIGTDRLINEGWEPAIQRDRMLYDHRVSGGYLRSSPGLELEKKAISVYSRDLTVRIGKAVSEYGTKTEQLDRSFVKRLLRPEFQKRNAEQVLTLFKELDDKRRRLTSLGLLTETEDVIARAGDQDVLELVSKSVDVFSLYVLDM